jgi:GNAT superfamily N-acetyltransferase
MSSPLQLEIFTLGERPDLRRSIFSADFAAAVPEFMRHDPTASLYYGRRTLDRYLDFVLAAVETDRPDHPVARASSVPFVFNDGSGERSELPDAGWDAVIRWAHDDWAGGRKPNAVSALDITVLPPFRARGISQVMLNAMRDNAGARGFTDLYAPVRPSDKHLDPLVSFAQYVNRKRPDGLPHDSWLRVHLRAGGHIVKVAPYSMVIAGTIAEWSSWTGMSFTTNGLTSVPGALAPIHVSLEQDHAVYVEPNVWVHHRLG